MMVENECNNEVKSFLFCFGPLSLMTKSNNTILVHSNLNGVSHLPSLVLCPGYYRKVTHFCKWFHYKLIS